MKILTISDEESKYIWDYFDRDKFKDVDLVISAGDLKPKYLSFLVTLIHVPLVYVHGNHDVRYDRTPPEGCINIEDDIFVHNGVRILGLGGSYQYSENKHQYTEEAMMKRIKKLKKKIDKYDGFDVLLTHAPAFGLGDGDDLCHKGFKCFIDLIEKYQPSYFIHGHQHLTYSRNAKRVRNYDHTTIINAFEYHLFDYHHNGQKKPYITKNKVKRRKFLSML